MIKTNYISKINLEALNLQDFFKYLQINNFADLCVLIKSLNLEKYHFTFYKARYKFGDDIILNGKLQFALENGGVISVDDPSFPTDVATDLFGNGEFNLEPLGLVAHNCAELYLEKDGVIMNELLFHPGDFVGIPKNLDPNNRYRSSVLGYNLSAGSKSAFMLQSIKDRVIYHRIYKETGINLHYPTLYSEHWKVFADITKYNEEPWYFEIIFFPRKFINLIVKEEFASLYMYLNKLYVKNYTIKHNIFNLWQLLYLSKIEKDIVASKYNSNYIQAIKELIFVSSGSSAAMQPSTSDMLGPFSTIKDFFREIYSISNPIIMEPTFFDYSNKNQKPVYISLIHQNVMKNISEMLSRRTKVAILQDILTLMDVYFSRIKGNPDLKSSELNDIAKSTDVIYFHNSQDRKVFNNILESTQVVCNDNRFKAEYDNFDTLSINTPTNFFVAGMVIQRK